MKTRKALRRLAVMGGLFALFGVFWGQGAQAEEPQAPNRPVRVMSWNIGYTWTNGVLDYPAVAKAIKASSPDVVGVQEILRVCGDRYGYDDQVAVLADLLDMHAYFSPVQEDSSQGEGLPRCQIGNAVFSRYPILEADYEILPWTLDYQRGVQDLLVNVRGSTTPTCRTTRPVRRRSRTAPTRYARSWPMRANSKNPRFSPATSTPTLTGARSSRCLVCSPTVGLPAATVGLGTRWTVDASTTCCTRATSGVRRTQVVPVVPSDHEQVVSDLLLPARQRGRH